MNLLFLTGKEKDVDGNPLPGDGWTLVEDYREPADGEDVEGTGHDSAQESVEGTEDVQPIQSTPVEETVTIDGKTYTKDELLALLNQTS